MVRFGSLFGKSKKASLAEDQKKALSIEWYDKGVVHYAAQQYSHALDCFDKALDINSNLVAAWNMMASTFHHMGSRSYRSSQAYKKRVGNGCNAIYTCLITATEADPQFIHAWINLGAAQGLALSADEHIRYLNKALEIDPNQARPWRLKAEHYDGIGKKEQALACYDKAVEINPNYLDCWFYKGNLEQRLHRREDAIKSYETYLKLQPSYLKPEPNTQQEMLSLLEFIEPQDHMKQVKDALNELGVADP